MTAPTPKRILIPLLALILSACGPDLGPAATPTEPSTPTPPPLALSVNGEGIPVAEFEAELARYQQAQADLGSSVDLETATQAVLNDLIDSLLLAQGATAEGYLADDATLQARIDSLAAQIGGSAALSAWQAAHGYTETDFRSILRRQMAAAWMRDRIAASVPASAEQVHVKQILLYNSSDAQEAFDLLRAGWDFDDLAARYDPVAQGELGWFPRGYLPEPAIEQAAFDLQPGQHSAVIQTEAGFHILLVVAREPARPLSPDARLTLQEQALKDWLARQRDESTVLFAP